MDIIVSFNSLVIEICTMASHILKSSICSCTETKKTRFNVKQISVVILIVLGICVLISSKMINLPFYGPTEAKGFKQVHYKKYMIGEKIPSFQNRIKTSNLNIYSLNEKYSKNVFLTDQEIVNKVMQVNNNSPYLSIDKLQSYLHKLVTNIQYKCIKQQRFGNLQDGGYEICLDIFNKEDQCIVYSFGINNDFSFDDAISKQLKCHVHSFDPTMKNVGDHAHSESVLFHKVGLDGSNYVTEKGWSLYRFGTIRSILGHDRPITVAKIDIEISEWAVLKDILETGEALQYIKQLAIEIHTPKAGHETMNVNDYLNVINLLTTLENAGFKKFLFHTRNNCCGAFTTFVKSTINRLGKPLCCYELFYVNKRYL